MVTYVNHPHKRYTFYVVEKKTGRILHFFHSMRIAELWLNAYVANVNWVRRSTIAYISDFIIRPRKQNN